MGHRQVEQAALFYEFSLERHVPTDHLLRSIDRFVELGELRRELAAFYSNLGRPSVDPELMIRMLLVGYCFGIRSERRLSPGLKVASSDRFVSEEKLDHNVLELRIIHSRAGSPRSQPGWAPRLEILCRGN